jgi:hypothetical protein
MVARLSIVQKNHLTGILWMSIKVVELIYYLTRDVISGIVLLRKY